MQPLQLMREHTTPHTVREAMGLYDVPCNGCTKCCHNDAVRILPHEDARRWETEPHPYMLGARMLAHKEDGTCVYLDARGCTRQDDKPQQCREMDCRRIAQVVTWTQARKLAASGRMRLEIWQRGKELLRSNLEERRHQCEVRYVKAMADEDRKRYLDLVRQKRPGGYQRLVNDVLDCKKPPETLC